VQSGANAGQLTFSDYANAVVIGHNITNPTISFYEKSGYAPLTSTTSANGTISVLYHSNVIGNLTGITNSSDYFTLQSFRDGSHIVIMIWGAGAQGAIAGSVYFLMHSDPLNSTAYLVHWQDADGNGVPDPADTFTVIFQGGPSSMTTPEIPNQSLGLFLTLAVALASVLLGRRKQRSQTVQHYFDD
jgi:hypothetical protein